MFKPSKWVQWIGRYCKLMQLFCLNEILPSRGHLKRLSTIWHSHGSPLPNAEWLSSIMYLLSPPLSVTAAIKRFAFRTSKPHKGTIKILLEQKHKGSQNYLMRYKQWQVLVKDLLQLSVLLPVEVRKS